MRPADSRTEVVVEIYSWFTEGFDTRDRKEAKALRSWGGEESRDYPPNPETLREEVAHGTKRDSGELTFAA